MVDPAGIQEAAVDSLAVVVDSLEAPVDSLAVAVDNLAVAVDSLAVAVENRLQEAVATTAGKVVCEKGPGHLDRAAFGIDRSDRRSFFSSCRSFPILGLTMRVALKTCCAQGD